MVTIAAMISVFLPTPGGPSRRVGRNLSNFLTCTPFGHKWECQTVLISDLSA
jgi:hypothetical protein